MRESLERKSVLPPHPREPFIRIVGEITNRDLQVGESVSWRIATHTICPNGLREPSIRQVRILDNQNHQVIQIPDMRIEPRDADLTRFDNQGISMDCSYEPVIPVDKLPSGKYLIQASLLTQSGKTVTSSQQSIKTGGKGKLISRIRLRYTPPITKERPFLGGIVRVGDVDGDGFNEIVHAVGSRYIGVYHLDGSVLWEFNDPNGALIYNTAPIRVYDIDRDGKAEVICARGRFGNLKLSILSGVTGKVIREIPFPLMHNFEYVARIDPKQNKELLQKELWKTGHAVRYVGGLFMYGAKIFIANFSGNKKPTDLLVQVGEQNCTHLVALNNKLEVIWTHFVEDGYGGHNPCIYDVDNDGCDEVIVGTRLIDHNGKLIWKKPFESFAAPWEDDHVDAADAGDFDTNGEVEIAYSSRLCVKAQDGEELWIDPTWHGQEIYAGKMLLEDNTWQLSFHDREYRVSGHLCHGAMLDVRKYDGTRLWSYRHGSMHVHRLLDWNGDDLMEIAFGLDLQRRPVKLNLGIFDGEGSLIAVLPRYGFGADVNNDGFDELVSWTQWPDISDTIEIYQMDHLPNIKGIASSVDSNPLAYNERD